ncbi:DUF6457 domain-containing protein [Streptomyces sp. NPDC007088]|uniref:DUF6457 domain-containing protein n=1 Tax=Streptomyces sp. NPDC007088 TaxID=3364773 RepID=UPI0036761255
MVEVRRGYDAVVLAGGAARRLGGTDKPAVTVGGRALIDRVLAACASAETTVVVSGPRTCARPVVRARENPPGGGPVAALDAGLRHTARDLVLVLSADLPFLDRPTVERLVAALDTALGPAVGPVERTGAGGGPRRDGGQVDGALLVDASGRDQTLVAVYRASSLRGALDRLRAEHGTLHGLPLRSLVSDFALVRVRDEGNASFDCDTWEDVAVARDTIREHGHVLDEWISAVKAELGIDLDVDLHAVLDLARDAAHGVDRPAAPLTTFLVGYAAGRAQGGPQEVAALARQAAELANRWAAEAQ